MYEVKNINKFYNYNRMIYGKSPIFIFLILDQRTGMYVIEVDVLFLTSVQCKIEHVILFNSEDS